MKSGILTSLTYLMLSSSAILQVLGAEVGVQQGANVPALQTKQNPGATALSANAINSQVDVGDNKKRVLRRADDDDDEEDTIDQAQPIPELIPVAEVRKTRGNGVGDDIFAVDATNTITEDKDKDREQREEGISDLDKEALAKKMDGRSPKAIPKECKEDGITCEENTNCCSGFCSWTRGFTCFTVAG